MSGLTSNTVAQNKAEPSRLKIETKRCKNELVTQKELIIGSVNRFKKSLRDFHYLEENGISTQKLGVQIEESYDKLCVELEQLVEDWHRYIRLAVLSKEPQPSTDPEVEILKIEIDKQTRQIDEYKEMVNQVKFENLDIFTKIENCSKQCREKYTLIKEHGLKPGLRPPPLTVNTNFLETKTFLRSFSTYIKSGEQSPGDLVFEVASNNVDSFWLTMFEGWAFNEETTLQEFTFMVKTIAKKRFSINSRRAELFNLKQNKNEDPLEFLNKIKVLVKSSDWYGISENEAICLFFEKGVRCSKIKNICYQFMEKHPEGDFQKLSDQLVGALTSEKPKSKENCTNCGKRGHLEINCWGNCPVCGEQDHSPGSCQLSPEKIKEKAKKRRRRKKVGRK